MNRLMKCFVRFAIVVCALTALALIAVAALLFIGKFNDLKTMLESDDIDGMRAMMRHSTERRALFDKKQKSDLFEYFMKGVELFIKSWYNK